MTDPVMTSRPKIMLLGDSLTQTGFENGYGWASQLSDVYQRRADVVNRGYSGYNTDWFLRLPMDSWQDEYKSTNKTILSIVWFGANDAALPKISDHSHVPLDKYRANLEAICTKITSSAASSSSKHPILIVTPPPVHHAQRLEHQVRRYGADNATGILERTLENTGRYAEACRAVAQELGHPCLDLFRIMQHQEKGDDISNNEKGNEFFGKYFHDGLHFSRDGHALVAREMLQVLNEKSHCNGEWKVQVCPHTGQWCNSGSSTGTALSNTFGPFHDAIDHADPQRAIDAEQQAQQQ